MFYAGLQRSQNRKCVLMLDWYKLKLTIQTMYTSYGYPSSSAPVPAASRLVLVGLGAFAAGAVATKVILGRKRVVINTRRDMFGGKKIVSGPTIVKSKTLKKRPIVAPAPPVPVAKAGIAGIKAKLSNRLPFMKKRVVSPIAPSAIAATNRGLETTHTVGPQPQLTVIVNHNLKHKLIVSSLRKRDY
jgi:hypothetical protein